MDIGKTSARAAALCAAIVALDVEAQATVWRPSLIETIGNDSAHYIEQAVIPAYGDTPTQPVVGQRFYVRITSQGQDPFNPRFVLMTFYPPAGVTIAPTEANPVRCVYFNRDGREIGGEFTHTVYLDYTFPDAPFRVFGCPQPPFQLTEFGYFFDRRDPQITGASWRVPALARYEMYIPFVASRPLESDQEDSRFFARFETTSGTAVADLGLHVSAPANAANMTASLQLGTSDRPGYTRVIANCDNEGPNAAVNARCQFQDIPLTSEVTCTPEYPVASLPPLQAITCTAEFRTRTSPLVVTVNGFSESPDWNNNDNGASLSIPFVASSADLVTAVASASASPGWARVVGQCTNDGPDPAVQPDCFFLGNTLPADARFSCLPARPFPDPMPVGTSYECTLEFILPANDTSVSFDARSSSADPAFQNLVHLTVPGASTDLSATIERRSAASADRVRVDARCANVGTAGAARATCGLSGLPEGVVPTCTPEAPVDLAAGASIACSAEFPAPESALDITVRAASRTADPHPENDQETLSVVPGADLKTEIDLDRSQTSHTRIDGTCTNLGPGAAFAVTCRFEGLPSGLQAECTPSEQVESLARDASIACRVDLPATLSVSSLRLVASSETPDPSPSDNVLEVDIPAPVQQLLRDGFESPP